MVRRAAAAHKRKAVGLGGAILRSAFSVSAGHDYPMSVAILFNPVSGGGRALEHAQKIKSGLELDGVRSFLIATQARDASHWLDPMLWEKRKSLTVIVVCGGDGAVRLVAPSAIRANLPMWIVPCGTENLFARGLGMRRDSMQFRHALRRMQTRKFDLGRANGSPFVLMGSLGLDARVVHELAANRRGPISHLSYVRPVMQCLVDWRAPHLAWELAGEREELGRGIVIVSNCREYGARLNPSVAADPLDGLLDASFIPIRHGLDALQWLPMLRWGMQKYSPNLRERRAASIRVFSSEPEMLQLDGEAAGSSRGETTIEFGVERSALSVLLPG